MDRAFDFARRLKEKDGGMLMDAFALCSDYCFNVNPFFTKDAFAEFIAPVLKETIDTYRSMGYYSIKHTDGNIMPILDQMISCKPDAFHSLDPQGGVDLKEMKRLCGQDIALIGNVNCGLLQTGSEEQVDADVRRALRDGMPGYGYVFSTSNCAYTGLALERYERMWNIWMRRGCLSTAQSLKQKTKSAGHRAACAFCLAPLSGAQRAFFFQWGSGCFPFRKGLFLSSSPFLLLIEGKHLPVHCGVQGGNLFIQMEKAKIPWEKTAL